MPKTKTPKPSKASFVSPYQQITERILADLKAGVAPWAKPWTASGQGVSLSAGMPMNFATRKAYRGVNVWLCLLACQDNGFAVPAFATFNQIKEMGGTVVKGSKATRVFFMSTYEREPRTPEEAEKVNDEGKFVVFVLKGYNVFNLAQVEGIEIEEGAAVASVILPEDAAELIEALGADVRHGGAEAFYAPARDFVAMPKPDDFKAIEHYKATLFHELGHWTGHDSRLARLDKAARFGNAAYAYEELVAELSAAFLCLEMGVPGDLRHADYIGHWIKLLTDHDTAFYRAAADAQRVLDFIREKVAGSTVSAEAADMAAEMREAA